MQREEALSFGDNMRAEELDREPELKLGPAANAIERREQFSAEAEGREYEPLTQRGARVHAVRQAKELDQDEIKQRLARIAGRELGADQSAYDAGADAIRDRLKQVLGRDRPDPRQEQQVKSEEEREKLRQLELERQRKRDRDLGWEL